MRPPELTKSNERFTLRRLQTAHSDLEEAIELAQQFAVLVRQRLPLELDAWLDKAKNSSVCLLRRFALGKKSDYDAVRGVTLSTSNGHFCWTYQPFEDVKAPNVWSSRT